jgi:hypothetical protein
MKTKTINLYSFDELNPEIQQKVIEKLYDINVSYEWWGSTYEDAKIIGLKITGFNLDRGSYCNGELTLSVTEACADILKNHGENSDTYKLAENFLNEYTPIFANYMDETHKDYESRECESKMLDLENEFLNNLCECYLSILRNEYEYLTSKEVIIESIEANDYTFRDNGEIENE